MKLLKKLSVFALALFSVVGIGSLSEFKTHENAQHIDNKTVLNQSVKREDSSEPTDPYTEDEKLEELDSNFNATIQRITYSDKGVALYISVAYEGDMLFSLGHYGEGNEYLPLKVEVELTSEDGKENYGKFSGETYRVSETGVDYPIGSQGLDQKANIECLIETPTNVKIKDNSVYIQNLIYGFEYKNSDNKWVEKFDLTKGYTKLAKARTGTVKYTQTKVAKFSDLMDINPTGISEFSTYYSLNFDVSNKMDLDLFSSYYEYFSTEELSTKIKDNVNNGTYYISTIFELSSNSKFYVKDSKGETHEVNAYSSSKTLNEKSASFCLFVEKEGIDSISEVILKDVNIRYYIRITETRKTAPDTTTWYFKFGYLSLGLSDVVDGKNNVISPKTSFHNVNLNLINIIIVAVVSFVYIVIKLSYFLYANKKYEDDEFKRVNKKAYLSKSIIGFLFFNSLAISIFYLISRTNFYNNAESSINNPMDVLIIVFVLIAFLLGCYFIKYYYVLFKETLEKNRREKLKLNSAQEDDSGTIAIKHDSTPKENEVEKEEKLDKDIEEIEEEIKEEK